MATSSWPCSGGPTGVARSDAARMATRSWPRDPTIALSASSKDFAGVEKSRGDVSPRPPGLAIGPNRWSVRCRSIHVVVTAVAGAAFLLLVFGQVGDQGVGGQQQGADAGGVLEGRAGDLGRVDDAGLDQVGVLVLQGVVAEVALPLGDLGDDDPAVLAGVLGDLVDRGRAGADDDLVAGLLVGGQVRPWLGRPRGAEQGDAAA